MKSANNSCGTNLCLKKKVSDRNKKEKYDDCGVHGDEEEEKSPVGGTFEEVVEIENPYLAMRAAKIARNQAILRELGLLSTNSHATMQQNNADQSKNSATNCKKKNNIFSPTPETPPKRRRSARIQMHNHQDIGIQNTPDLILPESWKSLDVVESQCNVNVKKRKNESSSAALDQIKVYNQQYVSEEGVKGKMQSIQYASIMKEDLSKKSSKIPIDFTFGKLSARATPLCLNRLFKSHGYEKSDSDLETCSLLGRPMKRPGKAIVMETCARRSLEASDDFEVSFNKYSGVQEWGNGVCFLWVNFGAPNSDIRNEFLQSGRHVTWFGGSRMHPDTPAIQALLRAGTVSAVKQDEKLNESDKYESNINKRGVVLWCREYITSQKAFGPYSCLGRLELVSFDDAARPLAFIWKLLDHDYLAQHSEGSVRQRFQSLVQTNAG